MRWKEYMEELYKKGLNPDCCNSDVSHPESDILDCEVKWALRSITLIKLVDVMKFQQNCSDS